MIMTDNESIDIWKINVEDPLHFPAEFLKRQTPDQVVRLLREGWVLEAAL